jgi:hypothetical protein
MNTTCPDDPGEPEAEPQPVGEILEELLAQYQQRFPNVQITVVGTAATHV